jgi:hypothetical protein
MERRRDRRIHHVENGLGRFLIGVGSAQEQSCDGKQNTIFAAVFREFIDVTRSRQYTPW